MPHCTRARPRCTREQFLQERVKVLEAELRKQGEALEVVLALAGAEPPQPRLTLVSQAP